MPDYHVAAGIAGIYAGTINKKGDMWVNKSDVTDEALCAVRDYLVNEANANNAREFGYEWERKDGGKTGLFIKITPAKMDKED